MVGTIYGHPVSSLIVEDLELPRCDALSMVGHATAGHFTSAEGSLELSPLNLILRL